MSTACCRWTSAALPCEGRNHTQLQPPPRCRFYLRTPASEPSCCCCCMFSAFAGAAAFCFALPFFLGALRCCFGAGSLPGMRQFARLFGSSGSVDPAGDGIHRSRVESVQHVLLLVSAEHQPQVEDLVKL
jgi:hypothetical protein